MNARLADKRCQCKHTELTGYLDDHHDSGVAGSAGSAGSTTGLSAELPSNATTWQGGKGVEQDML